jgi:hypothetical protein
MINDKFIIELWIMNYELWIKNQESNCLIPVNNLDDNCFPWKLQVDKICSLNSLLFKIKGWILVLFKQDNNIFLSAL